jgi:DNA-binding NtrC family response regulator
VTEVSAEVLERFCGYNWPGNVRELRNVLERAVILAGEGTVQSAHLPPGFGGAAVPVPVSTTESGELKIPVGFTIEQAERALIELTLEHTRHNKTRAAEILGISQKTLFNKLKEYGAQGAGAA